MSDAQAQRPVSGEAAAGISNAIVRLLAEYTGRGPTKARTHFNKDLVTVVLHDTMTKGERSLVREGDVSIVLEARRAFQNAMKDEMVAVVEQHSGQHVVAFLSANHIDPDVAVETFVLEAKSDGTEDEGNAEAAA